MIKLPYDEKSPYSIHHNYLYEISPTLSEVIKDLNWGFNKLIISGAVKLIENIWIEDYTYINTIGEKHCIEILKHDPGLWKEWPIIKNLHYKIKSGTIVGSGKIPKFAIIWIKNEDN